MELIPVGLDIGTGFVKITASGRTSMFPSLIGRIISDGKKSGEVSAGKKNLMSFVGDKALGIASNRYGTITRPVKHGLPHDDAGYGELAKEAIKKMSIDASKAVIVLGVPHDPNGDGKVENANVNRITKIIKNALNPHDIQIIPQAFGTLKSCSKSSGTVINVGHGTTEIISVAKDGLPDGFSIDKAAGFVTSQLGTGKKREGYVRHGRLFKDYPSETAKLVRLLAEHIADDVARLDIIEPVILAGGGSQIPGMRQEFERILKRPVIIPENPVYANAIGYEIIAKSICAKMSAQKPSQNPQAQAY